MLRITHSDNPQAAVAYFDGALLKGDYYAAEASGKWHGLAAARLGLIGTVDRDMFAALMRNVDPRTGERLTLRTKDNRRPGTDFTFNAPKSVSVLHALTGDERILKAFRQAVIETMREVEHDAKTRIRVKGSQDDRTTGNIAWAEFLHTTARPVDGAPDPHLHTHAFVVNATWDKIEQRWKALQLGDIVADAPYYEAAFHARLAHAVHELGYGIDRHGRYWDVAGLPHDLLQTFSRRTAEIDAKAEALGITNDKTKDGLGKRTRQRKIKELSPDQLSAQWRERAGKANLQTVKALAHKASRVRNAAVITSARTAVEYALQGAFERASVATEKSIFAAALQRGYGDVLPDTVRAAADTIELISGDIGGRKVITMRHILDEETRMIEFARLGRLSCRALAPNTTLAASHLNAGQRKAIAHVWNSPDRVMVVRGGAGTGKTTLMQQAVDGLSGAGHRVMVFAPTSAARDVLKAEGFTGAETLQRLLADERLQAAMAKSVLWVDEAGLISVPDMAKLFEIAHRQNARIVLSGDPGQHSAVTRGDALRLIEARAGIQPAAVTEILRQEGAYKDAVAAIAAGDIKRGWDILDSLGAIRELGNDERLATLARDYLTEIEAKRSVLVVSPTHKEKDRVTTEIRATLQAHGRLREERLFTVWHDLGWTTAQKSDPERYETGQWVRFTQNAGGITKGTKAQITGRDSDGHVLVASGDGTPRILPLAHGDRFKVYAATEKAFAVGDSLRITENGRTPTGTFVNGAIHTVTGFDADGNLQLDGGKKTLPRDYGAFDHGYASTSVSAQGRTVDTVLVAMSQASLPATFQEQFYVTISRGRNAVRVYTDDAEAVRDAIARSGQRGSATELVDGDLSKKLKPLTAELSRTERMKLYSETLARHVSRMAKASPDAGLAREAKQAAILEYQGRVSASAPELGG